MPAWCALCQIEVDVPTYLIGSRDGMNSFRVCESHVPEKYKAEHNEYHADRVLRQMIFEDGQLVEIEWPVENPPPPDDPPEPKPQGVATKHK